MRKVFLIAVLFIGASVLADKYLVCDFEVHAKDVSYSRVSLSLADCLKSGVQKEFKSGIINLSTRCSGKNSGVSFKSSRASVQRAFTVSKNSSGSVLSQGHSQLKGFGKIVSSCKVETKSGGNYFNQGECQ